MKKLYYYWNEDEIVKVGYFQNPPKNSIEITGENFIKPIFSNGQIIEGATEQEIAEMEKAKIPIQVKNMKFRLALIKVGMSVNQISQAIEKMPQSNVKEQIQTLWEYADYFERNDKTLVAMAVQFGITTEQLDNLFILAETL